MHFIFCAACALIGVQMLDAIFSGRRAYMAYRASIEPIFAFVLCELALSGAVVVYGFLYRYRWARWVGLIQMYLLVLNCGVYAAVAGDIFATDNGVIQGTIFAAFHSLLWFRRLSAAWR